MLKMSRLTDYGTGVLAYLAARRPAAQRERSGGVDRPAGGHRQQGAEAADARRAGDLAARRAGRLCPARPAAEITAAEVIDALEGPVALTECSIEDGSCELEALLPGRHGLAADQCGDPARARRNQPRRARQHAGRHRPRVDLRNLVSSPGKLARLERG
jgi:hypothetical protein